MTHHNLHTVVNFEVRRTITKRRFWIATLIVPLIIAVILTLAMVSSRATQKSITAQQHATFTFAYRDASGLVRASIIDKLGGVQAPSVSRGIAEVKSGRIDAFFVFPANPLRQTVRVYGQDVGVFNNTKYSTVATEILQLSAEVAINSPTLAGLARGAVKVDATTFKNGVQSPGINGLIAPLIYLVIFYAVLVLLGNQMLNSTLEEKENRVTEMILTTVNPDTLINGKILSLFIVGLVQMLVFLSPIAIGYAFFRSSLSLPDVNLSQLVFNPARMTIGALLLVGGFTLFAGTLVAIGAVMPTAKEAGAFFGAMMLMMFVPFYAVTLIVSHPGAMIVQFFTYFPYTAPITGMIRNAFGSLSLPESLVVLVELFAFGFVVIRLAIQLFRYGSIEYSRKVSVRSALGLSKSSRRR
ncbi:MAG TPA: ABC transporter permease [Acidimicrobiales bacterium]|nr:ABC transporter permease [Acidimicrobiales bacterium]